MAEGAPTLDLPSMPLPGDWANGAVDASFSIGSRSWVSGQTPSGLKSPEQNLSRLFPSCPLTSATATAPNRRVTVKDGQALPKAWDAPSACPRQPQAPAQDDARTRPHPLPAPLRR